MTVIGEKDRLRLYSQYQSARNYRAVARDNGVSESTVRRIVREESLKRSAVEADAPRPMPSVFASGAAASIPEKDYSGVESFLKAKQQVIIGLINKYLAALSDDEKIASATMPQIASAMSTLVEKMTVDVGCEPAENIDPLSKSFIELAQRLDARRDSSVFLQDDERIPPCPSAAGSPADYGACSFRDVTEVSSADSTDSFPRDYAAERSDERGEREGS